MNRYIASIIFILAVIAAAGYYFFTSHWEHRFDEIISRQARVFSIDEALVWSLIYEETYFRTTATGANGEIGLMQVTPLVARDWAKATGLSAFERQASENVVELLQNPERNVQIGCWYLEKLRAGYRARPAESAMMLAAYNAGPSRVQEWTVGIDAATITESDFIARIGIDSTKKYVSSILQRYRAVSTQTKK
ncbi:MAG: transglycosylase SLT domain-containing protein [Pyrinomonadaceae bacterium]